MPQDWLRMIVPILVVGIVLALRIRGLSRERRLRLETLWVLPALYAVVTVMLFAQTPPRPLGWALAAGGLALGAVAGWQRGRTIAIRVDPATHALSQRASPAGLLILAGLVVVRGLLRAAAARAGGGWHLDAAAVTEAMVACALGMFAALRLEMTLRARRLLAIARGGKTG